MIETLQQPELQLRTLRLYGELLCRRDAWAGQLVMTAFPGASGSGLAAAASLAGAASITVDSDAAAMKAHFRDGAYDFVVNTLDEALRAIKNEVRQGRPIAIGLMAEPAAVLQEAAERGVAAALVLCAGAEASALEHGVAEPAAALLEAGGPDRSTAELQAWLQERGWSPVKVAQGNSAKQTLTAALSATDTTRTRWVRNITTHQRSARGLWIWLSSEEELAALNTRSSTVRHPVHP